MTDDSCINRPILSICIPTYNRANQLENLFKNLHAIKATHRDAIEICVSNNNSTDKTQMVITRWQALLDLKVETQPANIGATLNAIAVTKISTGRWIQIIGDDDEFIPLGINRIVSLLETANPETWVLVGIADKNGKEFLLGNLRGISYSARSFRKKILQTGIYRYGFIGMHVIPSSNLQVFQSLSPEAIKSWPHLALFLRYIGGKGGVLVFSSPVVKQAGGGPVLFWKAGDWVRVNLKKIDIEVVVKNEYNILRWFYLFLILREFFSMHSIKDAVFWKVLEPFDFNQHAINEYLNRYHSLGVLSIFLSWHLLFILSLWIIPVRVFNFIFRHLGKGAVISNYVENRRQMGCFDGVHRGL